MTKCPHCHMHAKPIGPSARKFKARKARMAKSLSHASNAERDKEIARLYIEGNLTQAQIGERFGVSNYVVSAVCRKQKTGVKMTERITLWNHRHLGKTGRFASLIADAKANRSSEPPHWDGIAATSLSPVEHEAKNAR